jgi:hypothetical protein|tara:strand:+ start:467 stop:688 length:222 start_codon:yes stop_codon:yes gene_type:complete
MGIMTTQTLNNYYCASCAWVGKKLNNIWKRTKHTLAVVGTARAANQLANAGYYDAAKSLMLDHKRLQDQGWKK